jgi:hypothetical protein
MTPNNVITWHIGCYAIIATPHPQNYSLFHLFRVILRNCQLLRSCSVGYTHIYAHGSLVEWHGQWKTAVLGENTPLAPLCPPQIPQGLAWEYMFLFYPALPLDVSIAKLLAQILTLLSGYVLFISGICKVVLLASRHGAAPGCGQRALSIRDDPL